MRIDAIFFVTVFSLKFRFVLMDFYSSIFTLTKLSENESKLISALQRFIAEQEVEGQSIDGFLKEFLKTTEKIAEDAKPIHSPIDAFHLLKRWVDDWQKCFDIALCSECTIDEPEIEFNSSRSIIESRLGGWPQRSDLDATVEAIFRLWDVYEFDLRDFLHGKIFKYQTEPLTPLEVIYIANKAEDAQNSYNSITFLEALLHEIEDGTLPNSPVDKTKLSRMIASAYNRNNMPWKSVELLKERAKEEPENKRLQNDFKYFESRANSILDNVTVLEKPNTNIIMIIPTTRIFYEEDMIRKYKTLCRRIMKSHRHLSRLFCFYKTTDIPIFRVKAELANIKPNIYLFHDVISDNEVDYLRNTSSEKMTRSTILEDLSKGTMKVAENRISMTAWLSDIQYPILKRITSRVKMITGLETEYKERFSNTEQYQVVNYGVGGMYRPHLDALFEAASKSSGPDTNESGERIATVMFYLSDVMYGGATVFPNVKARVSVKKGSAAFWYNTHLDGEVDTRMCHAGCPVLVGSKWVSNKWIRENGQLFKKPCGLKHHLQDTKL
ncbi:prolyl 4-hydroxylase subunit alpha-1-like isoform X3 [Mytilus californianus]|uniref:prolyl 4-hydroxylase subunit alpha-1-like isoform X1 n=1 Tax=Mytilus californianus TaxID=6549 RepID=UPI002246973F|nr:prolyl 4-hydroxylase subunit alpha-1-like isoform X1 [Mytilus californianus]XP_052079631.1 prolyl 4-hydroxylase subunit alpha-1-like isoform X2 [Mytilus californianus]XP_052079632.1 prolyl 4-hydroxylase subunit alpha-1-like isoform X3 [Mytilus californianus]